MTDVDSSDGLMTPIRPEQLDPGAVIAQSLDNQWVPAQLTKDMIEQGRSLDQVGRERGKEVRAEYFRSLINASQVVINRAYFYNNDAINRDLVQEGEPRTAHQRLLASGAIVPFLLNERHPAEEPPPHLHVRREGFTAWQETLAGMPSADRVRCVRMSWGDPLDDRENREQTRTRLFQPFTEKVQGLTAKHFDILAAQVGVAPEDADRFGRRLGEVVEFSNGLSVRRQPVVRNTLYEEFVSVPGTNVAEGRYDRNKPFAGEIKQLLDLIYNVNLADALGRYPLTPVGSLRRVVLQEAREARVTPGFVEDPEQLLTFLRRQAFSVVQDRLTPAAVDELELQDIWRLRQTSAWNEYIRAFGALTAAPEDFHDSVGRVFDRYVRLNAEILRLARERRQARPNPWRPVVEVVVTLGAATFTAISGEDVWDVAGALAPLAVTGSVSGSVQLVLRNRRAGRQEQRFAREMAAVRLAGEQEWHQFLDLVRRLPGYREEVGPAPRGTASATTQDNEDPVEY
ncbi:hypothetical protein AB0L35_09670 [Streptomyces sp. NPDC052309]|uniref:Uncharacterized protein n=1 Tax=Streptomyces griseicoloratus TaxID=2752516 RepID=A0A926L8I1_9ACTN|nr:hypothetical protein [Streptomyces griseicoloratus]MBD0422112.1 hypothetical protein [Streptomyces griseicoloratus]